jgi:hypothetical protein
MRRGPQPKSEEQKIQERITELETKIDKEQIYEKAEAYRNIKAAQDKNGGRIDARDAQQIKLDAGLEAITFVSPNDERVRQEIDKELNDLRLKASQIEREKADRTVAEAKARETARAEQDKQLISRLESQGFVVQRKPEQENAVAQNPSTEQKKPNPVAPATSSPQEVELISRGDSDDNVKFMQNALHKLGYNIKVDGIAGQQTEQIIKEFQAQAGITVDGIAGPQTRAALEAKVLASSNMVFPVASADNSSTPASQETPVVAQNSTPTRGGWNLTG